MTKSAEEIMNDVWEIQSEVPFRTKFERENFVYNDAEGPRLVLILCQDLTQLYQHQIQCGSEWEKQAVIKEMNIVLEKLNEVMGELGVSDPKAFVEALEEAEPDYWSETLSRRAAVEALASKMSTDNMSDMLNLPLEVYEQTIQKCQTYLNVVNKTTRQAERVANRRSQDTESEE
tara:strand:+ start:167 stop:691 length:525 start_codon:yes stop_codon:yes gene_type:complete